MTMGAKLAAKTMAAVIVLACGAAHARAADPPAPPPTAPVSASADPAAHTPTPTPTPSAPAAAAPAAAGTAQSQPKSLMELVLADELQQVGEGAYPVENLEITSGHVTIVLKRGLAAVVRAGGEPVGIFFQGQ